MDWGMKNRLCRIFQPATGRTVIEVLEPADGARLEGPPVFRWVPPEDRRDGPFALHLFSPNGRIWLSTEQHGLRLSGGEWTIPGDFWSTLTIGEELLGKLRSLPDRAQGESVEDVPQSATFRVVRVR